MDSSMKSGVGRVFIGLQQRLPPRRLLRRLPSTVCLAVFGGMLVILFPGAGNTNSKSEQLDTGDARAPARIAEVASCTRYGINRIVELRVAEHGQVPCEVAYLKPDEDQSTTSLWRARNDSGYCALKFSEFINKLEGELSWNCGRIDVSTRILSAAPADPPVPPDASVPAAKAVTASDDAVVPATEDSSVKATMLSEVDEEVVETVGDVAGPATQASIPKPRSENARQQPALAAALATNLVGNDAGAAVSMDDVRARIPSGPYESMALDATDGSVCPPGGSFFWNTRNPDQPVFEMGKDAEFTFSTARGRVGQGFALRAEPALIVETDNAPEYRVALLSAVGSGTVAAQVFTDEDDEGRDPTQTGSICQYRLGGR